MLPLKFGANLVILSITFCPISTFARPYPPYFEPPSIGNHIANADAACLPAGARLGSCSDGICNTTVGSAGTIPRRQSSHCC